MDLGEDDLRFCVYLHKDEDGNVVYVGSGNTKRRPHSKNRKNKEHLEVFDSLTVEIVKDNISKSESLLLEQEYINTFNPIFNKVKKVSIAKPVFYKEIAKFVALDERSNTGLIHISSNSMGKAAGSMSDKRPYGRVVINGIDYGLHRVLYSLYHKIDINSNYVIDHVDGNTKNNSIENLRMVTVRDNCLNLRKKATANSGHKNITWYKSMNLWMVHWKENFTSKTKAFNPRTLYPSTEQEIAKELALNDALKFREDLYNGILKIETIIPEVIHEEVEVDIAIKQKILYKSKREKDKETKKDTSEDENKDQSKDKPKEVPKKKHKLELSVGKIR